MRNWKGLFTVPQANKAATHATSSVGGTTSGATCTDATVDSPAPAPVANVVVPPGQTINAANTAQLTCTTTTATSITTTPGAGAGAGASASSSADLNSNANGDGDSGTGAGAVNGSAAEIVSLKTTAMEVSPVEASGTHDIPAIGSIAVAVSEDKMVTVDNSNVDVVMGDASLANGSEPTPMEEEDQSEAPVDVAMEVEASQNVPEIQHTENGLAPPPATATATATATADADAEAEAAEAVTVTVENVKEEVKEEERGRDEGSAMQED
ncbi:hypothetical protein J3Q64DRAFT_1352745 [Phycomyces blakesleeanus]|uniref:Uncharacterized protein n=1 Tax=Phycomyces blakesleeanus TaxID=4837 RepID=A0ABR3AK12_PHYBL